MKRAPASPWLALVLALALALSIGARAPAAAQSVSGRIADAITGQPVVNAAVDVGGERTTSSDAGTFRVRSVSPGTLKVTVTALGYRTWQIELTLRTDTTLIIALEPDAIELDSVVGETRTVRLKGEVRDRDSGMILVDVDVTTDDGRSARSGNIGRYTMRLAQGVPVQVRHEAFAYLPLTVRVEAQRDTSMVFELAPDSVALRMIANAVAALEKRARGLRTAGKSAITRAELMTNASVGFREQLEREGFIRRVACVLIDDVQVVELGTNFSRLRSMLPDRVERVELLMRGAMLRIYTREYVRSMIAGGIELSAPRMIRLTSPPTCF